MSRLRARYARYAESMYPFQCLETRANTSWLELSAMHIKARGGPSSAQADRVDLTLSPDLSAKGSLYLQYITKAPKKRHNMKLLLCITVLSTAVLAESCTGDAATQLNNCLDSAYGKVWDRDGINPTTLWYFITESWYRFLSSKQAEDCKEDTKCVCESAQAVVK